MIGMRLAYWEPTPTLVRAGRHIKWPRSRAVHSHIATFNSGRGATSAQIAVFPPHFKKGGGKIKRGRRPLKPTIPTRPGSVKAAKGLRSTSGHEHSVSPTPLTAGGT